MHPLNAFHLPRTADGQVCVLNGVLRAAGRQALGATLHTIVMWGLGGPLAYLLGFRLQLGVVGLWMAPLSCTVLQAIVFHTVVGCWDWQRAVEAAQELVGGAEEEREEEDVGLAEDSGMSAGEWGLMGAADVEGEGDGVEGPLLWSLDEAASSSSAALAGHSAAVHSASAAVSKGSSMLIAGLREGVLAAGSVCGSPGGPFAPQRPRSFTARLQRSRPPGRPAGSGGGAPGDV